MESPLVVCPACRALLEPALPLCIGCARVYPDRSESSQAVIVRQVPPDAGEVVRLLVGVCGLEEAAVRRYLQQGPALFRLPASALVANALVVALTDAGAVVELREVMAPEGGWGLWARTLSRDGGRLGLLGGGVGLTGMWALQGGQLGMLAFFGACAVVALDGWQFQRRIVLSPALLAHRLGLLSEGVARAAGAALRRARSSVLREAITAVMVEHARLLATVARGLREHPALQGPFREALDHVGQQTLRIAENAVTIEEATDAAPTDLPARLEGLRALGSAEVDRQLRALLSTREDRLAQLEWLRQAHGLLLVRLETAAERLRVQRHQAARLLVGAQSADVEGALGGLQRELEVAALAFTEVERGLPRALPEVVAEVLAEVEAEVVASTEE
jgi:hypothetical protein